jgi:putative hydrolase
MPIIADLHCHTTASGHAYSTVTEIAAQAAALGLKAVAITDHGPALPGSAHPKHFENLNLLPTHIFGVRILRGVEANIINADGGLDLPDSVLAKLDVVIAGFHGETGYVPGSVEENTAAIINCMKNPHVHIFSHPENRKVPVDPKAFVEAAAQYGKVMEVNNHSLNPISGRFNEEGHAALAEMVAHAKRLDQTVVVNSDAHYHMALGRIESGLSFLAERQFPENKIVNCNVDLVETLFGINISA